MWKEVAKPPFGKTKYGDVKREDRMFEHKATKHKGWNIFMGLMSAAMAGFLLIHSLKKAKA